MELKLTLLKSIVFHNIIKNNFFPNNKVIMLINYIIQK